MITTKQLFIKFLKNNNAYEEFMYNFEIHGFEIDSNKITTKEFFINTFYREFLTHAFNWKDTIQGYNYWCTIDYKWCHIIMMKEAKYGNN